MCGATEKDCRWDVNYVSWDTFSKKVKPSQKIKIRLLADEFGPVTPVAAECMVTLNDLNFNNIRQRRWDAPVCVSAGW